MKEEKRGSWLPGWTVYASIGVALAAGLAYRILLIIHVSTGAYLYRGVGIIAVCAVVLALALFGAYCLRRMLPDREEASAAHREEEEPENMDDTDGIVDTETETVEDSSDIPDIREELPGWEIPEHSAQTPANAASAAALRAQTIAQALAGQRGNALQTDVFSEASSPEQGEDNWSMYDQAMEISKPEPIPDLYDALPMELPEGYVPVTTEDWEPVAPDSTEDLWEGERGGVHLRHVIGCLAAAALTVLTVVLAGSSFRMLGDNGISVHRLFATTEYTWSDVTSYQVHATLIGSELEFTLKLSDGRTVKFDAEMATTAAFQKAYQSQYEFFEKLDAALQAAGASKTVADRGYLEHTYRNREDDSWYYVSRIIGIMED